MSYEEISTSYPKARKTYHCEWCNQVIDKNEIHFQRSYKWEGNLNSGRMHLECEDSMNSYPHDDLRDGWQPGDFDRGQKWDEEENAQV